MNLMPESVPRSHDEGGGLDRWWRTSLGSALRDEEAKRLHEVMPRQYCPVGLQLGDTAFRVLDLAEVGLRLYLHRGSDLDGDTAGAIVSEFRQLPFPAGSVDLVVLPHVLEYSSTPHAVLREVSETLTPGGYVVICGFNPTSLWGLRRMTPAAWRRPPWTGRFYSSGRVQDWLSLLGFELRSGSMLSYGPPLASERLRRHTRFFESAGDRWWPLLGGVYILVAERRELGVSPLPAQHRVRNRFSPRLVQPVTRVPDTGLGPRPRAVARTIAGPESPSRSRG